MGTVLVNCLFLDNLHKLLPPEITIVLQQLWSADQPGLRHFLKFEFGV